MSEEVKNETENEVKNIVTIEDAGICRKKVSIEVPEEAVKNLMDDQYKDLRKEVVLPGFRRGRAPFRLLEKKFGKDINEQTKLRILADATEKALEENKIDSLGEPDINHEDYTLPESGSFKFDFEVNVRPEFELPALDAIKIEKPSTDVSDEEVQSRLDQLLKSFGTEETKDKGGKVEVDDTVVCDAVFTPEEGEAITREDLKVIVRNGGYCYYFNVEKLADELVGAKVGDEKAFTIEDNDKKYEAKLTIKEITFSKPAELNAELFEKLGLEDETSLREKVTDMLEDENERQAQEKMSEVVRNYLKENTKMELPDNLVSEQSDSIMQRQYSMLLSQKLSEEELKSKTEELQTQSQKEATEMIKSLFIMDKVAETLNVEISPNQINGYIAQMAAYRGIRPEKMREQMIQDGSLTNFTMQAREQACLDKLIEMNLPKKEETKEDNTEASTEDKN